MTDNIEIPRPHVPYGPAGIPEALADADYLDSAARNLSGGYAVGGYNVTTTVIKLLHDTATALRHAHERELEAEAPKSAEPQGEPSDAQIDAAARAMHAITNQLSMSGARDLARAGLRAAGVGGVR